MAKNQRLELTWFNKDKALLSEGDYTYHWISPRDPRYCETRNLVVDEVVTGTQAPKEEDRVYSGRANLEPTTDNLLIRGDSGDVLEALTRIPEWSEKYLGKVKLVYIDPPFNTEKTFDHYADNLEHSVWLTMMRDRLLNLKKLLADDGSIWVHLDDSENHRMRLLLDEVFGAGNFVAEVSWEKVTGRDNRSIMSKTCDFITVYAKNKALFKGSRNLLPRGEGSGGADYINPDSDPRGLWTSDNFTAQFNPAENKRESQIYTLVTPAGNHFDPPAGACWRFTEPRYRELVADNRVWFGADGQNAPRLKRFLSEVQDGLVPKTLWPHSEVGTNDSAKKEVQRVVPAPSPFTTPKPERLLERIIHIATNPGDIVLDNFGGSGTTAAVAHKMGRRWVTCELLEDTVNRFTLPRLTKVVKGEDPGGITVTAGGRVDASEHGLPEDLEASEAFKLTQGLTAIGKHVSAPVELDKVVNAAVRKDAKSDSPALDSDEAKELRRLLRKLKATEANEVDFLPHVRKVVGQKLKTEKSPNTINWRGGGSFQVAHLAPACYDYDPELEAVMLTEEATGTVLVDSVVTQLGFERTCTGAFDGKRGNMRLRVIEGLVTTDTVDQLLPMLGKDERLMLAATAVDDSVRDYLRKVCKGSAVKHVPDDLFPVTDDMLEEDITAHLTDPTAPQEAN